MKWQVVLSIKRTIVFINYSYNFNLKYIENLRKNDLHEAVSNWQKDNEKLNAIFKETMSDLLKHFGIKSIEEIDQYLKCNIDKIIKIISFNPNFYELNLNKYESIFQDNIKYKELLEILRKQKKFFNSKYDSMGPGDTIYKDLLYIVRLGNYDLIEIYDSIIRNKFFNPNSGGCYTSNEKFWCRLPSFNSKIDNIVELNRIVILDSRTDYQIFSNGMSYINIFTGIALNDSNYSIEEKKYNFNLVKDAIKLNKCSIIDTTFRNGNLLYEHYNCINDVLFGEYPVELQGLVTDLRKYLLSNEGVNQQIINSRYPTELRNESIDLYIDAIDFENKVSSDLVKKLKSLKI